METLSYRLTFGKQGMWNCYDFDKEWDPEEDENSAPEKEFGEDIPGRNDADIDEGDYIKPDKALEDKNREAPSYQRH